MTTSRPTGTGIQATMSLADACERPRRGRPAGVRNDIKGRLVQRVGRFDIASLRVSPETVARFTRIPTADETRRLAEKFAPKGGVR